MKKILIVSMLILIGLTQLFAFFFENPANLVVSGNAVLFSMDAYQVDPYVYKIAWQQRSDNLCGELGYTIDSNYSEGLVNYKLSDTKSNYGMNLNIRVIPWGENYVKVDVGGKVADATDVSASFAVYNITLYASKTSDAVLPNFVGGIEYKFNNNFGMGFDIGNFGTNILKFSFSALVMNFEALGNLKVSYSPLYRLSDGNVFNVVEGSSNLRISNFIIKLSGFYNFNGSIATEQYLRNQYGLTFSIGVGL
ncbi:MAG TPA: hypothetical protein PKI14_07795 [Fervidobacterium sp.]|nr:hypothetical protein [Fervidobacterium sp.]HOM74325.1 hypothetical protein [Fervidobacterium sp.]HOQ40032.1 hypothetical protein [Fervidobacterium sp.]HPP18012.1 hypothetical protein [Fervidobacterium sp.]HPT54469.1 hypothetical protein [Fervidobacterium sp.]